MRPSHMLSSITENYGLANKLDRNLLTPAARRDTTGQYSEEINDGDQCATSSWSFASLQIY